MSHNVRHSAYTGCSNPTRKYESPGEARDYVARLIVRRRRQGFPVAVLDKGKAWEILEPDNAMMIPDECGTITLAHVQPYECRECGSRYDDADDMRRCCQPSEDDESDL